MEVDQERGSSMGPIRRALTTRLEAKSAELVQLASELHEQLKFASAGRAGSGLSTKVEQLKQAFAQFNELARWLGMPLAVMSESEQRAALDETQELLLDAGRTPREVVSDLGLAKQSARGRTPTKRRLAVDALDLWLTNPELSWPQVTRRVCNCGRNTHGHDCYEQLRQQVNDLRAALRKLRVVEPPRASET